MQNNYISSKVLIAEMFEDYNLQSSDFVSRFPYWVINCLDDINIIQNFIEEEIEGHYTNGKFEIPFNCKGLIEIKINDKKYIFKNSKSDILNINPTRPNSYKIWRYDQYSTTRTVQNEVHTWIIDNAITVTNINTNSENSNSSNTALINGNWVYTDVPEDGTYYLRYKAFPLEFDEQDMVYYPLIYNEGVLKQAIKYYIMKNILMRGYVHPIMNLRDNNPFTNAALAYNNIRIRARNKCNKFNNDRRNTIVDINRSVNL